MENSPSPAVVCVTGASGFIGSWLVMRLLERGYVVRASVLHTALKHLLELPKAKTNLTLWRGDLREEGSFDDAVQGCHAVFHVACPIDFSSKDPETYYASKTLAEKAAWKAAKENNIDFISIIPTLVIGPFITPTILKSLIVAFAPFTGNEGDYQNMRQCQFVHVDEHPETQGRYICSSYDGTIYDVAKIIQLKWPEYNVPNEFKGIDHNLSIVSLSSNKLTEAGFKFKFSLEDMFEGAIETCKNKGLLPNSCNASEI